MDGPSHRTLRLVSGPFPIDSGDLPPELFASVQVSSARHNFLTHHGLCFQSGTQRPWIPKIGVGESSDHKLPSYSNLVTTVPNFY